MASRTWSSVSTADRAERKCNSISQQLAHSSMRVVTAPPYGMPQRSQNGAAINFTPARQSSQTNPWPGVARASSQSWQTSGYTNDSAAFIHPLAEWRSWFTRRSYVALEQVGNEIRTLM